MLTAAGVSFGPKPQGCRLSVGFVILLATMLAPAQTSPSAIATYPAVTIPEITAFMQSCQTNPKAMLAISTNPKRVPLLLGAIKREPAGPWVRYLHAFCFQADRASTWKLPSAGQQAVYSRMIEYLSVATTTTSKAFIADPQNQSLKYNLHQLEQALTQAHTEASTLTNRTRPIAGSTSGSNSVPRPAERQNLPADARQARAQVCASNLRQIELAKQMWRVDEEKPGDAVPKAADLTRYFPYRQFPKCPEGGAYTIGKLNEKPRCSKPGHDL